MTNIVYIATSLDGYIADREGGLDWLCSIPNPDNLDFGFSEFMDRIDAVVMGRNTFDAVRGFDGEWPYGKPVFVLSNSSASLPGGFEGKVELVGGDVRGVVAAINGKGYETLYIDGGKTIQGFLREDLIDELIITRVPVLLGGGVPLFGELNGQMVFEHLTTDVMLNAMVRSHYRRRT